MSRQLGALTRNKTGLKELESSLLCRCGGGGMADTVLRLLMDKNMKSIPEEGPGDNRPASAAGIINVDDQENGQKPAAIKWFCKRLCQHGVKEDPIETCSFHSFECNDENIDMHGLCAKCSRQR